MLKSSLPFKKNTTLRANNWRIFGIQNAKFSGYYFYMNTNIRRDFQICISVTLYISVTLRRQQSLSLISSMILL